MGQMKVQNAENSFYIPRPSPLPRVGDSVTFSNRFDNDMWEKPYPEDIIKGIVKNVHWSINRNGIYGLSITVE